MPKYASRINLLITNVSSKHLLHNEVYELYSLRWQIEIIFKTWKSIFKIHEVKPVKLERFQCHLYGQLIGLCLVASITYRMRRLIWENKQKEVSEYKCTYIVKIYFSSIHDVLFTTFQHPVSVLTRLFQDLVKTDEKHEGISVVHRSISLVSLKNVRKDFTKPYKNTKSRESYLSMSKTALFYSQVLKISPMPKGIGLIFKLDGYNPYRAAYLHNNCYQRCANNSMQCHLNSSFSTLLQEYCYICNESFYIISLEMILLLIARFNLLKANHVIFKTPR